MASGAFLMSVFASFAEDAPNCIWLKHSNNTESCVLLESSPQIFFSGESVNIGTRSYSLDDIVSYRFGSVDESSADAIAADGNYFVFGDNIIEINGQREFTGVNVYDTKGVSVKKVEIPSGATAATVDISGLSAGVYFLSVSDSSIKFITVR